MITATEEAYCNRCKSTKPKVEFNHNSYDGTPSLARRKVQVWCRDCARAYDRVRDTIRGPAKDANIRARKLGLEATLTPEQVREVFAEYNNTCAYCDNIATDVDHYLPLSLGGPSTKENIRPACHPCNISKGNKHPDQWKGRKNV